MPTTTLTRVAHRAVVLNPGVRTAANSSRHFFLPSTVIPIQRSSAPHYYNQQRFATVDTSGNRRVSGSNIGKAAETIAADIDSDLDYPTEMDERYSTSSWSDASSSTASPRTSHERTASGIGSEPNRPSYKSNAASDATVSGGDNTLL